MQFKGVAVAVGVAGGTAAAVVDAGGGGGTALLIARVMVVVVGVGARLEEVLPTSSLSEGSGPLGTINAAWTAARSG